MLIIIIIIIINKFKASVIGTKGIDVTYIYNYPVINTLYEYWPYRAHVMAPIYYLYAIVMNYTHTQTDTYHMLQQILTFSSCDLNIALMP
jgi:hypothetical protein